MEPFQSWAEVLEEGVEPFHSWAELLEEGVEPFQPELLLPRTEQLLRHYDIWRRQGVRQESVKVHIPYHHPILNLMDKK